VQNHVLEKENDHSGAISADSAASRAVGRTLERRRATYADEVQRLLDAAFALIRDRGELEPRVAEIVRAAGLSNQAFYRHFRSKHELLVAVLDEGVRTLADYLAHRMEGGNAEAQTRAWIQGMCAQALDGTAADATRPFVSARGRLAEAYPHEVALSEGQVTALVRDAISQGRRDGVFPNAAPERDAEALYHLTMGWLQARLLNPDATTAADSRRLEALALAGLKRTGN
jgi:AcrR family transcriptional regulator